MSLEHCRIHGDRRVVREEEEAQAREKAMDAFRARWEVGGMWPSALYRALDAYRAELTLQALKRGMGWRTGGGSR